VSNQDDKQGASNTKEVEIVAECKGTKLVMPDIMKGKKWSVPAELDVAVKYAVR